MSARLARAAVVLISLAGSHWLRADETKPSLAWDTASLRFASEGGYARIVRLDEKAILLSYESHGRSYVKRSTDRGRSWDAPVLAAKFEFGSASNPQPVPLDDGTLLLFYNERPRDGKHPFTIRMTTSTDGGRTWTPRADPMYSASSKFADGCWEPAAVQLKSGEIQLFFANENPYRTSDEQEISLMRSSDGGKTWTEATAVSFRKGHRDGMPVPIDLRNGSGVAVAIEDNGLIADHQMKPTIFRSSAGGIWNELPRMPASPDRWGAVEKAFRPGVYAGAPYLCQPSAGVTLLSCQSDEDQKPPQAVIYVGDGDARHFARPSHPFPTDAGKAGSWNSLFAQDAVTVTAVSSTTINGRGGVWLIDGALK